MPTFVVIEVDWHHRTSSLKPDSFNRDVTDGNCWVSKYQGTNNIKIYPPLNRNAVGTLLIQGEPYKTTAILFYPIWTLCMLLTIIPVILVSIRVFKKIADENDSEDGFVSFDAIDMRSITINSKKFYIGNNQPCCKQSCC